MTTKYQILSDLISTKFDLIFFNVKKGTNLSRFDIENIVMDTFQRIEPYIEDGKQVDDYVGLSLTTARNLRNDLMRKYKAEKSAYGNEFSIETFKNRNEAGDLVENDMLMSAIATESVEDVIIKTEKVSLMDEIVADVCNNEKEKIVFDLKMQGFKGREINAMHPEISESNVKVLWHRLRSRLSETLVEYGVELSEVI